MAEADDPETNRTMRCNDSNGSGEVELRKFPSPLQSYWPFIVNSNSPIELYLEEVTLSDTFSNRKGYRGFIGAMVREI